MGNTIAQQALSPAGHGQGQVEDTSVFYRPCPETSACSPHTMGLLRAQDNAMQGFINISQSVGLDCYEFSP